jgi:hypothetical protein
MDLRIVRPPVRLAHPYAGRRPPDQAEDARPVRNSTFLTMDAKQRISGVHGGQ